LTLCNDRIDKAKGKTLAASHCAVGIFKLNVDEKAYESRRASRRLSRALYGAGLGAFAFT